MPFLPSVWRDPAVGWRDKLSNFPLTIYAMQLTEEDLLRLDVG
jgi:hypothetical protein